MERFWQYRIDFQEDRIAHRILGTVPAALCQTRMLTVAVAIDYMIRHQEWSYKLYLVMLDKVLVEAGLESIKDGKATVTWHGALPRQRWRRVNPDVSTRVQDSGPQHV